MEILGLVVGSVGALGLVWNWARRARLRLYLDPEHTGERLRTRVPGRQPMRGANKDGIVEVNPPGVWYHLRVVNDGHKVAAECRGQVDMLEQDTNGRWQRHPEFRAPIPLAWANTGAELVVDIHPDRPVRLDIGCALEDEDVFHFHCPLPPSGTIRMLSAGRYRLTVVVLSKNAKPASVSVVLDFGGDWDSVTVRTEN